MTGTPHFYDFGSSTSPVASGYTQVLTGRLHTGNNGFGWDITTGGSANDVTTGGFSDTLRDFNKGDVPRTFQVALPNGTYLVEAITGHGTSAVSDTQVTIENTSPESFSTSAGQFHTTTRNAYVADGVLSVKIEDTGDTGDAWYINELRVTEMDMAPQITNYVKTLRYDEGDPALHILAGTTTVTDEENDFRGGSISVSYTGLTGGNDRLEFTTNSDTGAMGVTVTNTSTYSGDLTYNGVKFGTFTGGVGTAALTASFVADPPYSSALTGEVMQTLLRSITWRNTNNGNLPDTSRTLLVALSDGQSTTVTQSLNVYAVNDAPTMTGVANQTIVHDTATGPLSFTVNDVDTPLANLTFSVGSTNPTLIPTGNVVFGGSGTSRTVTITPAAGQTGNSLVSITLLDNAGGSITRSFYIYVRGDISNWQPATIFGDVNNDGVVSATDADAIATVLGSNSSRTVLPGTTAQNSYLADVNGDWVVDSADTDVVNGLLATNGSAQYIGTVEIEGTPTIPGASYDLSMSHSSLTVAEGETIYFTFSIDRLPAQNHAVTLIMQVLLLDPESASLNDISSSWKEIYFTPTSATSQTIDFTAMTDAYYPEPLEQLRLDIRGSESSTAPAEAHTALHARFLGDVDVNLEINEVTDPQEENPGVYVGWNEGNDPNATTYPSPELDADLVPGVLTIGYPGDVIYGDLDWQIPTGVRVWWQEGTDWVPVGPRAGYATGQTETIYVEGLTPGSGNIEVTFTPESTTALPDDDTVKATVVKIDVDIDSDNTVLLQGPAQTLLEEEFEDDLMMPGKYVVAGTYDRDGDRIVDFADGYDFSATPADDANAADHFTPLTVFVEPGLDVNVARVKLSYTASPPTNVSWPPELYPVAPGALRLWKTDGSAPRAIADFVNEGVYTLAQLGFPSSGDQEITLFVEGINPSGAKIGEAIKFELDPDGTGTAGFIARDTARATVIELDLDIDSDNNGALEGSDLEDHLEIVDPYGKYIVANLRDKDNDGIIDRLDGYDADGVEGSYDDASISTFEPLDLVLPEHLDVTAATTLRFQSGIGAPIRIWLRDGTQQRNIAPVSAGGDLIVSDQSYALANLGLSNSVRSVRLYVEGLAPTIDKIDITAQLNPDGPSGLNPPWWIADTVGMRVLWADLDVDNDKAITDATDPAFQIDGALSYLPGYEGDVAKVTQPGSPLVYPDSFNNIRYVGQQMNLVMPNLLPSSGITKVTFSLFGTTSKEGYAENKSDDDIEVGSGNEEDFSFQRDTNDDYAEITIASRTDDNPGTIGGTSYVEFWAKDFGGKTEVRISYYAGSGPTPVRVASQIIPVPLDGDMDELADRWERSAVAEWNTQYGSTHAEDATFFFTTDDNELIDPDASTNVLSFSDIDAQGGAPVIYMDNHGDAEDDRTVFEEYRGYILDGGGHDWWGDNQHSGGHRRLSPSFKELLVEVDAMTRDTSGVAGVEHMPERAGIATWIDAVAKGASQAVDGAGIRIYYVIQNLATPYLALLDEPAMTRYATDRRLDADSLELTREGFTHLQLVDEIEGTPGRTLSDESGTFYGVDGGAGLATEYDIPATTAHSAIISHELMHTYAGLGHDASTDDDAMPLTADEVDELNDQMRMMYDNRRFPHSSRTLAGMGPLAAAATNIPLSSVADMPSKGYIRIGPVGAEEKIWYTGIDHPNNTLTGAAPRAVDYAVGTNVLLEFSATDIRQIMYGLFRMARVSIRRK